jgi:hypothetical protein
MVFLLLLGCDLESLRPFQIIGASLAGSAPSGRCPMTAGEIVSFELTVVDGTNREDRGGIRSFAVWRGRHFAGVDYRSRPKCRYRLISGNSWRAEIAP